MPTYSTSGTAVNIETGVTFTIYGTDGITLLSSLYTSAFNLLDYDYTNGYCFVAGRGSDNITHIHICEKQQNGSFKALNDFTGNENLQVSNANPSNGTIKKFDNKVYAMTELSVYNSFAYILSIVYDISNNTFSYIRTTNTSYYYYSNCLLVNPNFMIRSFGNHNIQFHTLNNMAVASTVTVWNIDTLYGKGTGLWIDDTGKFVIARGVGYYGDRTIYLINVDSQSSTTISSGGYQTEGIFLGNNLCAIVDWQAGKIDVFNCADGSKIKTFTSDVIKNCNINVDNYPNYSTPFFSLNGYAYVRNLSDSKIYKFLINGEENTATLVESIGSSGLSYKNYHSDFIFWANGSDISNLKNLPTANYITQIDISQKILKSFNRDNMEYYAMLNSTATASQILDGKVAYSTNGKLYGTMPNNGQLTYTPTDSTQTIPAGYTTGGTISAMDITTSSDYNTCDTLANSIIGTPGYIKLDYIKNSGTQYIDTLIFPDNTIKIQVKLNMSSSTGDYIIGSNLTSESTNFRIFNYSDRFYLDYSGGDGYGRIFGGTWSKNTDYEIEIGNTYVKNLLTDTIIIDGATSGSFSRTNSIRIYDTNGIGKIYYCKIWQNNILVRDFIPVRRKYDNIICLFDKVSSTYFMNQGTGEFITDEGV